MEKSGRVLGLKAEDRMRNFFKGEKIIYDEADFETKNYLWEVKSCNLLNNCHNGNPQRKFKENPHKEVDTHQLGRFNINPENHRSLKRLADNKGKQAKYVFVVRIGKQMIFQTRLWKTVSRLKKELRTSDKKVINIYLGDIFK